MAETVKVCVKQQYDTVIELLAAPILKRLNVHSGIKRDVKFNVSVSYGPTQEDPFADICTLTITE